MICRPVAIYLHTSIGDTRLQLNQIVKKQFSSYDMSVKEISLFGIRHFPILLLVASPTEANKRRNQSPTINQEPDFITFVSKNQNHPHFVPETERNHKNCLRKKRNFVPETKKIISLNPSNPPMFYQPIHPFLQQTNHL